MNPEAIGDVGRRPLLAVRDLRVRFGAYPAVDGVSFELATNEVLGIVGESGSGKSVSALALMRLVDPPGQVSARTLRFDGREVLDLDERQAEALRGAEIAMIFQEPMTALNPVLSIGHQVMETVRRRERLSARVARERAVEMLARVGIPAPRQRIDDYPHQLSGGMRQRVMIAMALMCSPKLLIADEPTTALDVTIQAQILELLRELREAFQMSVILISHDLGVVADFADRVLVMYAGKVVEQAEAAAAFEAPLHPYTAGLLASIPDIDSDRPRLAAIPGVVPPPFALPPGCRFEPRCAFARPACAEAHPPFIRPRDAHWVACVRHTGYRRGGVVAIEPVTPP